MGEPARPAVGVLSHLRAASRIFGPIGPAPAASAAQTPGAGTRVRTRPQTFSSRNSRSQELITRKKVSYSLRLTEI